LRQLHQHRQTAFAVCYRRQAFHQRPRNAMAYALEDYLRLLDDLVAAGFPLHPIRDYFAAPVAPPFVYLRHDIERQPRRALAMARREADRGIRASYYFRCDARGQFPAGIMRHLADLGHEVGFRYECLGRCRGNTDTALVRFETELAAARQITLIETVAPLGQRLLPAQRTDSTTGVGPEGLTLLGDAAAIDYTHILYITDSGGCFGSRHNRHDHSGGPQLGEPVTPRDLAAWLLEQGVQRVMLNCHPERWPRGALARLDAGLRDRIGWLSGGWRRQRAADLGSGD